MGSAPNWYQTGNKTYCLPKISKFYVEKKKSTLTGLSVSSLACKCVFYRPENNEKVGPSRIEF